MVNAVGAIVHVPSDKFPAAFEAHRRLGFKIVATDVSKWCESVADLVLYNDKWSQVTGILGNFGNFENGDDNARLVAERFLTMQLNYCIFLGIERVIISVSNPGIQLALALNNFILLAGRKSLNKLMLHFKVARRESDAEDPWKVWTTMSIMCREAVGLSIMIELTDDITDEHVRRWLGSRITAILLPESVFTTVKGKPVLTGGHFEAFKLLCSIADTVYFSPSPGKKSPDAARMLHYLNAINDALTQAKDPRNAAKYNDVVQTCLQPLAVHLRSQEYVTFEMDQVKYTMYEMAFRKAVACKCQETMVSPLNVVVAGAGRGPLVSLALDVLTSEKVKFNIYAVEKNPNAILTLNHLNMSKWSSVVRVIQGDVRKFKCNYKADVLLSEMLGSFGDNELAPECLQNVGQFLKENGICIPSKHTAFMAPVQAPALLQEINTLAFCYVEISNETPVVVRLLNFRAFAEPKPLSEFVYPNREYIPLRRYNCLKFVSRDDGVLSGFAGYFRAVLYDDVVLSTLPDSHTPDMDSWFAMFFPLRDPVMVRKSEVIEVHIWRRADQSRVWYEWCLTKPLVTSVQNPNGRASYMSLNC